MRKRNFAYFVENFLLVKQIVIQLVHGRDGFPSESEKDVSRSPLERKKEVFLMHFS